MPPEPPKLTGGKVNYYLAVVSKPLRENQEPYTAECEDIMEALDLTRNEANIFKAIWRGANARKGNGKPGLTARYDAEKMAYFANLILKREQERSQSEEGT